MRPASEVSDQIVRALYEPSPRLAAVIEADRAALVAEIVAWLRTVSDPGATFQDRRLAYQIAAANFASEIEAKWGVKK